MESPRNTSRGDGLRLNQPIPHPTGLPERRRVVVIPTYNEAANLPVIAGQVLRALSTDVLVVDDASPDGTGAVADALAAAEPRIAVIHRAGKSGLGPAYVDGFQWAIARGYEQIFQMDADGSHAPCSLPALAAALEEADLVIGSRYAPGGAVENWSPIRRAVSRGGSIYSRLLLGLPVRDTTAGFKGWRAPLLQRVLHGAVPANGYVFQVEMTYRAAQQGATVHEVPILFADRTIGQSKFSMRIIAEASLRVAALGLERFRRRARRAARHTA
ncbi:MAG: polyprenol monophosphomannose synthase [Dehalococcoidia bacterium]